MTVVFFYNFYNIFQELFFLRAAFWREIFKHSRLLAKFKKKYLFQAIQVVPISVPVGRLRERSDLQFIILNDNSLSLIDDLYHQRPRVKFNTGIPP